MISFDEFKKCDFCTAKIAAVDDHPNADRLYVVKVDLGDETRQIVAGIKKYYTKEELIGKNVVIIKNLEPAVIRGVESKGMLLATKDQNTLSIITPEREISLGTSIT